MKQALTLAATVLALLTGAVAQVNPPTVPVTYGAVIRYPVTGDWTVLNAGAHIPVGVTTVSCATDGYLDVYYDPPLVTITTNWVSTDETLTARGIIGGASVNLDKSRIRFTSLTANGPVVLGCDSSLLRGSSANFWFGVMGTVAP